jgi:hypothetical protein
MPTCIPKILDLTQPSVLRNDFIQQERMETENMASA